MNYNYLKPKLEVIFEREITYKFQKKSNMYYYSYFFKNEKDNKDILFLTIKIAGKNLTIESLVLPKQMRLKKIGTNISNEIISWAKIIEIEEVHLYASNNSEPFWSKQKFIKQEKDKNIMFLKI